MAGPQHAYAPPVVTVSLKPPLLSVADAERLDAATLARLPGAQTDPGQRQLIKLLGLDQVVVERAEGPHYLTREGRRILDFFGGAGALALGHSHPRLLAARRRFHDERQHEIAVAFLSQYGAALAHNLAVIAPGDLDMVALASTGAEAMETAIGLARRAQGPGRSKIVRAGGAAGQRSPAALGEGCVPVPFGDIAAVEAAVRGDAAVGIVVMETVEGAEIVEAPDGFWQDLRDLCDRTGVLWVADEVNCGMGRTGRFFAFEHEGVTPDIAVLAKALGGGTAAVAATIARRPVQMKAGRQPAPAPLRGPTAFGGSGEACCLAVEALNVLYDEGLMENAARQGERLIARLQEIAGKYPQIVREARGRGLMVGLEFCDLSEAMPFGLRQAVSALDGKLGGSLAGFVSSLLLHDYDVLAGAYGPSRNVMRLEPPLIVSGEHVDRFADALDDLLSRGVMRILADILKRQAANDQRR